MQLGIRVPGGIPQTPAPPERCRNVDTWLLDYFPSDTKSSHTRHKSFEAASSTECSSNVNPERISSSKPMPLSPATTLEHLPQVVSRELNLKCSVADGNGARGAHPSKCHRSLLAINPEYADAALSDVLVIGRKELRKWLGPHRAGIRAKDDPLVGDNESPHAVTFPEWDPVRGPLLELAPRGFPHHPLIFLECDGSGLKAKVDKTTDQTLLRQLLDLLLDGGLSFLLLSLERDPPLLFGLHQPRGLLLALARKIVELFAQLGFLFLTRKITYEAVPVTEGVSLAYRASASWWSTDELHLKALLVELRSAG